MFPSRAVFKVAARHEPRREWVDLKGLIALIAAPDGPNLIERFAYRDLGGIMKQKKIETHKIGLVGQAPSRRGDPRKPLAGPNGQKIARLAGMSYDELIACRRKHLNTHHSGKRSKGDAFDRANGYVNAGDILLDWRVERIVLLGKNVAHCFGFRDVPFLAEIHIYGRRFLIFPHPSGINRWWNERRNERRARQLLQRFLRGETVSAWVPKERPLTPC